MHSLTESKSSEWVFGAILLTVIGWQVVWWRCGCEWYMRLVEVNKGYSAVGSFIISLVLSLHAPVFVVLQ